jgi:oxygen-independent coproporphyrinogen-3 oxidase
MAARTKQTDSCVPVGIYIQVPFCQAKCTYCNFHTGVFSVSLYAPYVQAVCREIQQHDALYRQAGFLRVSRPWLADTLYIGGGTPSLLMPSDLVRLIAAVRESFSCELQEVTLEADPETITPEKAAAWSAAGINRISLGVQSFHDKELKAAGRRHRRKDIFRAVDTLREAGFANLSFDLIAGLPYQTAESWTQSVHEAVALRPEHLSIYLLEVDEDSRLGAAVLSGSTKYSAAAVPNDDEMATFYAHACEVLATAGYEHYEISNWARRIGPAAQAPAPRSFRSQHNLKYWRRQPYLGFGAGAHSFNGFTRWANVHDPAEYVRALNDHRLPVEQVEQITQQQALEEEIFLGLRQLEGIDLAALETEYNVCLNGAVEHLERSGMLCREGNRVRLSPAALTVASGVIVELLEAAESAEHRLRN